MLGVFGEVGEQLGLADQAAQLKEDLAEGENLAEHREGAPLSGIP
ncbi:MAG TPA: hypothetical protein VMF62_13415 [Acetobacteraceae bacterium]|nr:hypothetical protein [Acetobacteraceae bacterium]